MQLFAQRHPVVFTLLYWIGATALLVGSQAAVKLVTTEGPIAAILGYLIPILVAVAALVAAGFGRMISFAPRRFPPVALGVAVAVGYGLLAVSQHKVVIPGVAILVLSAASVACTAIFEEIVFRGVAVNAFLRTGGVDVRDTSANTARGPIWRAAFASSLIFAVTHFVNLTQGAAFAGVLSQVIYTFFLGLLLAWIYMRSGSLLWPILAHWAFNFLNDLPTLGKPLDPTSEQAYVADISALVGQQIIFIPMVIVAVIGLVLLARRSCRACRTGVEATTLATPAPVPEAL